MTVSSLADACPSLAHHPGDLPGVVPHDVTADVDGSLRAEYLCPVCGRTWSCWWDAASAAWPSPAPPSGHRISTRAELVEDFAELRSWGLSVDEAAARLGVTPRTATRYAASLRDEAA